jgi:hypothetical protein
MSNSCRDYVYVERPIEGPADMPASLTNDVVIPGAKQKHISAVAIVPLRRRSLRTKTVLW